MAIFQHFDGIGICFFVFFLPDVIYSYLSAECI